MVLHNGVTMGKALYRAYRPTSLEDVVGQEHITDTLRHAIKTNAISHAYLFTGPRGVGKTSVARILAHEINNLSYDESKTHLDIIEIDAASNRRIDEIRELRDKVHIAPTNAKYKVYVIDEVHMLTREAFNALLKTLEEPPAHAIFILATTEAHKVPDTIISRTQRYSFKPIENSDSVRHLSSIAKKENIEIETSALQLIAEHGRGSFRDSIGLLDQLASFDEKAITRERVARLLGTPENEVLLELIDSLVLGDSTALFATMQSLREKGINASTLAQNLITALRLQLAEKTAQLTHETIVNLMKELLVLTGTGATMEAVEIALLGALQVPESADKHTSRNTQAMSEATVEKSVVKKSPAAELEITLKKKPEDSHKLSPSKNAQVESSNKEVKTGNKTWDEVLNTLKKSHNTLYGLLRVANVTLEEDSVKLQFQFEFHKKQLLQAKNLQTVQTLIVETLGKPYTIDIVVSKESKPKEQRIKPAKIESEALSSVSNIFGGAELLES
jgi:DNA polymerase-3 subunit gamma/tau